MRKLFTTIIFSILAIIQPLNNVLGLENSTSNTYINGTALLEKNREQIYPSNLEYLDKRTPISLEYNQDVKKYIDFYIIKKPHTLSTIIGKSSYYFPMFEEILSKHNLPLELKNLAVIESGLNPMAVSSSGAVGLWQFLFHTSKMFDLKIDSYTDERRDPTLSTEAACDFLAYLYRIFNDWQLAITAYNCGPGMIEKAIEQANGSTDYWDIRQYLSLEARNYYPKFVAACYSTTFYNTHGITPTRFEFNANQVDKVEIKESVWFKQIAENTDISEKDLRLLNPVYKQDYVPVYDKSVELLIPKHAVKIFQQKESQIYAQNYQSQNYYDLRAEAGNIEGKIKTTHYVKRGEYFHQIAINHGCTIYDIMKWNNLSSKNLKKGQELTIYISGDKFPQYTAKLKPLIKENNLLVEK